MRLSGVRSFALLQDARLRRLFEELPAMDGSRIVENVQRLALLLSPSELVTLAGGLDHSEIL